jgi:hypothetical protein
MALVSGKGRADAHVAVDGAGELYISTKTDGVLRIVTYRDRESLKFSRLNSQRPES